MSLERMWFALPLLISCLTVFTCGATDSFQSRNERRFRPSVASLQQHNPHYHEVTTNVPIPTFSKAAPRRKLLQLRSLTGWFRDLVNWVEDLFGISPPQAFAPPVVYDIAAEVGEASPPPSTTAAPVPGPFFPTRFFPLIGGLTGRTSTTPLPNTTAAPSPHPSNVPKPSTAAPTATSTESPSVADPTAPSAKPTSLNPTVLPSATNARASPAPQNSITTSGKQHTPSETDDDDTDSGSSNEDEDTPDVGRASKPSRVKPSGSNADATSNATAQTQGSGAASANASASATASGAGSAKTNAEAKASAVTTVGATLPESGNSSLDSPGPSKTLPDNSINPSKTPKFPDDDTGTFSDSEDAPEHPDALNPAPPTPDSEIGDIGHEKPIVGSDGLSPLFPLDPLGPRRPPSGTPRPPLQENLPAPGAALDMLTDPLFLRGATSAISNPIRSNSRRQPVVEWLTDAEDVTASEEAVHLAAELRREFFQPDQVPRLSTRLRLVEGISNADSKPAENGKLTLGKDELATEEIVSELWDDNPIVDTAPSINWAGTLDSTKYNTYQPNAVGEPLVPIPVTETPFLGEPLLGDTLLTAEPIVVEPLMSPVVLTGPLLSETLVNVDVSLPSRLMAPESDSTELTKPTEFSGITEFDRSIDGTNSANSQNVGDVSNNPEHGKASGSPQSKTKKVAEEPTTIVNDDLAIETTATYASTKQEERFAELANSLFIFDTDQTPVTEGTVANAESIAVAVNKDSLTASSFSSDSTDKYSGGSFLGSHVSSRNSIVMDAVLGRDWMLDNVDFGSQLLEIARETVPGLATVPDPVVDVFEETWPEIPLES